MNSSFPLREVALNICFPWQVFLCCFNYLAGTQIAWSNRQVTVKFTCPEGDSMCNGRPHSTFFKLWLMCRSRKYWYPHQRRSSEIPSWGWVISIAKLLRKVWSYTGHSRGEGWGGVTNQTTILGEGMDIFWNHTIPVYGNAISSAKLLDSKSNYWILIPLNAFSRANVKIILTRICVTKKNTKLTSFGFFLRYCTMDCLNSPCGILIPFTKFSCSDNA